MKVYGKGGEETSGGNRLTRGSGDTVTRGKCVQVTRYHFFDFGHEIKKMAPQRWGPPRGRLGKTELGGASPTATSTIGVGGY